MYMEPTVVEKNQVDSNAVPGTWPQLAESLKVSLLLAMSEVKRVKTPARGNLQVKGSMFAPLRPVSRLLMRR